MRAVPLFRTLPADRLTELAEALVPVSFAAGDVVFRLGDPADALFLVDEGHVEVMRGGVTVAMLGPGSFVGEMGLLLDEVRSADLRAASEVALWSLEKEAVSRLLSEHPDLVVELSRQLSARLAATTSRIGAADVPPTVTAVWGEQRLGHFVDELAAVLGRPPALVRPGESLPAAAAETPHVLALVDAAGGREARTVLRRAAHVVCLQSPPEWVVRRHSGWRVVRCDGKVSLARAARIVAGRSVGLALSSGGSKTVAHIGAVDVLRQSDVPVDVVAGSSGGSLVAVAVAAGIGRETMVRNLGELADLLNVRRWDVNVPPRTGVIKGRRLRDAIDRWFEGRTFDDLLLPACVVATDLATGAEVIIDSGPVADAIRASLSIPGVFDPWVVAGRPAIDGAVVDPLPTTVVRDRGAAIVVASNVAGKAELDEPASELAETPGVMQTMLRMINLMERELLKAQLPLADVVIRPRVAANYSFDFTRIDEFVAEGERAARATLDSLRREGSVLFPEAAGEPRQQPFVQRRHLAQQGAERPSADRGEGDR